MYLAHRGSSLKVFLKIQFQSHTSFFEMYKGSVKLTRETVFPTVAPNASECVKLDGAVSLLHFLMPWQTDPVLWKRGLRVPICSTDATYSPCNDFYKLL